MKHLLVPCDFSNAAVEAFKFAVELAASNQSEVMVMKAIDVPIIYEGPYTGGTYVLDPPIMAELEARARKDFDQLKSNYVKGNILVSFTIHHGSVAGMIRQIIDDKKPDLVVMGTQGASGWDEFFVGSNTEKIVRHSNVPVMVIRKAPKLASIKDIVLPTTLESDQVDFMAKVKELQSLFGATLHLLIVNTPGNLMRGSGEKQQMEKYTEQNGLKDFTINIREAFSVEEGITNFVHEIEADMLAMGTHGRKGIAHLFMGSITEDLVNHIHCPIWTSALNNERVKIRVVGPNVLEL